MEPLVVNVVYFYPKENAESHNTSRYEVVNDENPTTVVRRGQPFNGVVRFDRSYDEETDIIQLVFTLENKPQMDTQGSMFLSSDAISDNNSWSAKLTQVQGEDLSFEVFTPVYVPIGSWTLRVVTRLRDSIERQIYVFDQDIYILFNPWNPDDQTYMEDCNLLQEYVLNDVGKVWVGSTKSASGKPWVYGQFDASVLPACMFILDRAQVPFYQRGDPIKLTRAISRIVNSNDDAGVLVGRWSGQYEDGTSPSEWTGSVDILQQYFETQQGVRYGQCWVFSSVVTTVCRALGIPCRSVTNFVSAHDANNSLSVDKYYTEHMEELDFDPNNPRGADSIWNYHVWNDVWMARPDLPEGYGGWQAIDATPQETSSGFYQCGPAPLEAIKQGVLGVSHDVEFMLSCVNADLLRWRVDPYAESGYSVVDTNDYHVGRMILTKKPFVFDPIGDEDREDITDQYKYREGTVSERIALMNGIRFSERAKRYYSLASNLASDVTFKLRELDSVPIGQDFSVVVDIQNNSDEERNIKVSLSAFSVFYNGVRADVVKKVEGRIFIAPNTSEEISIQVTASEYLPKLVEYCNMKISAMVIVEETKQSWADNDDFHIIRPNINIQFNEDLMFWQPATAVLSFDNPLEFTLTGCECRLASSGISGRTLRLPVGDVDPQGQFAVEIPIQPSRLGNVNFVATFTSAELKDVHGAASVEVYDG
ncbi:hemocyte protein-glutamine gamma-glutamyltransferase-like [Achroia grisella]|uniref:hemocyte protein-glutamine gamma-glutamyltransferase-like n=1 Tax=Achroia grisella TaxID=688607 RepID=UPI0027D2AE19|nr:hemocyte protein-glutamine gamma-glutamyltransferase-like [Achroia grisella]